MTEQQSRQPSPDCSIRRIPAARHRTVAPPFRWRRSRGGRVLSSRRRLRADDRNGDEGMSRQAGELAIAFVAKESRNEPPR